jgi:hypothetical protein
MSCTISVAKVETTSVAADITLPVVVDMLVVAGSTVVAWVQIGLVQIFISVE